MAMCNNDIEVIYNSDDVPFAEDFVRDIVLMTLDMSNVRFASDVRKTLTVVFVSDDEIRSLNAEYRGKNKPTDVLSFQDAFAERPAPGVDHVDENISVVDDCVLGDIIISCATIRRYATMDSVQFERLVTFVIAHGVLHLLGYNHSDMMFEIQDRVTEKIHETYKA